MTDTAQLLQEAKAALHQLQLGKQAAKIEVMGQPGRSVTYTQADVDKLTAYVQRLEAQLATESGSTTRRRGCITFQG